MFGFKSKRQSEAKQDFKLSVHHVGGRNGTIPPLNNWRAFLSVIDVTLYEADAAAADRARELLQPAERKCASVHVAPHCLGQADGVSDFHICFDGSSSSMLPLDPACSGYSFFTDTRGKGVYTLGAAAKSEIIQVNVRSLQSLIEQGEVKAPDVLSVDVEGAALQVLKGVGDQHFKNIAGLFLEASLIPVHKGEASFHEIFQFLSEHGFLCIDFGQVGRYSMAEMHIGAFDRGPQSHIEDALFLRNPTTVDTPEVLEKLALVAIMTGALSIAYECFKKLNTLTPDAQRYKPSPNIGLNCLYDFHRTWSWYKDLKLPKIEEVFTAEFHNHYQYVATPPGEEIIQRQMQNFINSIPKYQKSLSDYEKLETSIPTHDVLFEKYGLPELAKAAKAERLRQLIFIKSTLEQLKY